MSQYVLLYISFFLLLNSLIVKKNRIYRNYEPRSEPSYTSAYLKSLVNRRTRTAKKLALLKKIESKCLPTLSLN